MVSVCSHGVIFFGIFTMFNLSLLLGLKFFGKLYSRQIKF